MSLDKHIWEGWTVQDFVDELEPILNIKMRSGGGMFDNKPFLSTKSELKDWCKDNQPYYKKHIPQVVNYFAKKFNLK